MMSARVPDGIVQRKRLDALRQGLGWWQLETGASDRNDPPAVIQRMWRSIMQLGVSRSSRIDRVMSEEPPALLIVDVECYAGYRDCREGEG